LDSITFSGYGEPTLFLNLRSLVLKIKEIRDIHCPKVPIRILTNSSLVRLENVFNALKEFDFVIAKLDVGSQRLFERVNRPVTGVPPLEEIVKRLADLQRITGRVILQTLLFKSADHRNPDNCNQKEVSSISKKILKIDPLEVQIYTISRYPSKHYVTSANYETLRKTARKIDNAVGKDCTTIYT
jgi:wyosine [tRNA(Phe)-imidazoG37] synthetase (radical SAM superfamily)